MWAREKYRAEQSLFSFARDRRLRVIAYRPDYIAPTREEMHIGQMMLYGFFAPVGAAVRAREIGEAMIEVTARGATFASGSMLTTRYIHLYAASYRARLAALPDRASQTDILIGTGDNSR